jgi:hypothetical protein
MEKLVNWQRVYTAFPLLSEQVVLSEFEEREILSNVPIAKEHQKAGEREYCHEFENTTDYAIECLRLINPDIKKHLY